MRIMIKGGVWKNTEDEILKAAVMKYGLNQWARISSLLVRKSAKQCKARWYEWLDPSIKKTEWSQSEDEKLLHLAKIMPCQWKTIAPIVGRTAAQCLERYEHLLDAAQEKYAIKKDNDGDAMDEDSDTNEHTRIKRRYQDDPRRLRQGEIDPHPETKPARPDPIDMDEDEKEMLSEARARLANTKGKKAKRKAREKQLQHARRLASLQKRREMRAAGLNVRIRQRKRNRYIDYNREIPFYHKTPRGFYDTSTDDSKAVQQTKEARTKFKPMFITDIEGERRDDIEERERRKDVQRQKLLRKINLPEAIMRLNRLNDPQVVTRKKDMNLPTPQVSESELEDIAKLSGRPNQNAGGSAATQFLVSDGSNTPHTAMGTSAMSTLMSRGLRTPGAVSGMGGAATPGTGTIFNRLGGVTPMRTPHQRSDEIMQQARNALIMANANTPLLGGENRELADSDWNGVTPKVKSISTPNPLALAAMATPLLSEGAATTIATPMRDTLGINTPSRGGGVGGNTTAGANSTVTGISTPMLGSMTERQYAKYRKKIRKRLRSELSALPPATNEYAIALPDLPAPPPTGNHLDMATQPGWIEDATDADVRAQERLRIEAEKEFKRRSQVLQSSLPRPTLINPETDHTFVDLFDRTPVLLEASEMLRQEMIAMVQFDNHNFPQTGKPPKKKRKLTRREFSDDDLAQAQKLLDAEIELMNAHHFHLNSTPDDIETTVNAAAASSAAIDTDTDTEMDDTETTTTAPPTTAEKEEKSDILSEIPMEKLTELSEMRDSLEENCVFIPRLKRFGFVSNKQNALKDKLAARQQQFAILRAQVDTEIVRNDKAQQKADILTKGYRNIATGLKREVIQLHQQLCNADSDLRIYKELQSREAKVIPARLQYWKGRLDVEKGKSDELQKRFDEMTFKIRELKNTFGSKNKR